MSTPGTVGCDSQMGNGGVGAVEIRFGEHAPPVLDPMWQKVRRGAVIVVVIHRYLIG